MPHEPKRCRTCKAPIFWAQSAHTGKSMPVDATPSLEGNVQLLDRAGSIIARVLSKDEREQHLEKCRILNVDPRLRTNHFATCPQAKEHRRKD